MIGRPGEVRPFKPVPTVTQGEPVSDGFYGCPVLWVGFMNGLKAHQRADERRGEHGLESKRAKSSVCVKYTNIGERAPPETHSLPPLPACDLDYDSAWVLVGYCQVMLCLSPKRSSNRHMPPAGQRPRTLL